MYEVGVRIKHGSEHITMKIFGSVQPPVPSRSFLDNLSGRSYVDALLEIGQEYGSLVKLNPWRQHYLVADPVIVHRLLVSERENYVKDPYLFGRLGKLLGRGLLTNLDDSWRHCRRELQAAFQKEKLHDYQQQNKKILSDYLQRFESLSAKNTVIDIGEEMAKISLMLVSANLFSLSLSHDQAAKIVASVYRAQFAVMRSMILSPYWPTLKNGRFFYARKQLRQFCQLIFEQRAPSAMYDDMLHLIKQSAHYQQDFSQGIDEMMTFLIAGHETIAAALTWTWYILSQYPETLLKLKQEIAATDFSQPIDTDIHLVFCQQVIEEVLRLYPPIWAFPRRSIRQDTINGFTIPANAAFVLSPYVMHRLPCYWSEPHQFIPERFSKNCSQPVPKHAYMPFGGGSHVCIAGKFALHQTVLTLAMIIQRIDVEILVPKETMMPLELLVSLRPGQKILAKFHCR